MIRYSVRTEETPSLYAAFRVVVPRTRPGPVDFVLPSWVPGSYWIQDAAKFLVDVTARSLPAGEALPVERVDKARWRVGGTGDVELRYRAYGHSTTTEGLDVDADHLFFTGVWCLPYVDGRKDEPCELALEVRPGHRAVVELEAVGEHPLTYRAPNYDVLADTVVDVGTPTVLSTSPRGIPHRVCLCGRGGNYDAHRVTEDIGKIAEATMRYMDDAPVASYTFYWHIGEAYDGGLEHLASNSCVFPRLWFRPEVSYRKVLAVAAHEYLHLYNVKRIRPAGLGPFDYTQEVYTRLLWLMEGTTDYVSWLVLREAGLLTPAKFLEGLAKNAQIYLDIPGRHHRSLEEASMLSWIDLYHRTEETVNRSVSYYLKGELVSLALDLELRERTDGRASLRDVMRHLWTEYGRPGRGIPEGAFPEIVRAATGEEIGEFVRRYIAGTEELDLDTVAGRVGLSFGPVPRSPDPDDEGEPGYLGLETKAEGPSLRVTSVRDGTPGRLAGIYPHDEIVALDRTRVVPSGWEEMLKRYPPGTAAELTVFRKGWLTEVPVTFGRRPPAKYRFRPRADATPAARARYEAWVGAPWEPAKPDEAAATKGA